MTQEREYSEIEKRPDGHHGGWDGGHHWHGWHGGYPPIVVVEPVPYPYPYYPYPSYRYPTVY
ncbi:hypothetical protein ABNC70_08630 [Paenibacillus larvae]